jgi:murein DD-endopeptidase MepM/ murein hydrolase activator NlpD
MADTVTVKKGDTLSAIAKAAGTTVKAIQSANPQITNANLIKPGQVFTIPGKAPSGPTGPTGPTTGATTGASAPTGPTVGSTGPTLTAEQLLAQQNAKLAAESALANRQSAYDLLLAQFTQYGLQGLVEPLKGLIQENISPAEFAVRLRQTEPYKKRFAANASRVANGLTALSEGAYIALEDQYQKVMRNYGLPASYYAKDSTGKQAGFESLISGDVDATELEDRIVLAQKRVNDADPNVKKALKEFYPDIKDADILAYTLDPTKGMEEIKRKVTAAEIGGAALGQKLTTSMQRAEELARLGVDAATARQGYESIAEIAPRGSQLAAIYGGGPYGQTEAEQEIFGLSGSAAAGAKRKKLSELERSAFSGQAGTTAGALSRDRSGSF